MRSRRIVSRKSGLVVPRSRRRGWGSAVKTPYNGVVYASKAEATYARRLDEMVESGEVLRWVRQVNWPLRVNGVKVCSMIPDFMVWIPDGRDGEMMELHEVKGFETPVWRLKKKLFAAIHPDITYVVIPAKELV